MLRRGKSAPGMSLDRGSGACLIGPRAATRLRIPNGAGKMPVFRHHEIDVHDPNRTCCVGVSQNTNVPVISVTLLSKRFLALNSS